MAMAYIYFVTGPPNTASTSTVFIPSILNGTVFYVVFMVSQYYCSYLEYFAFRVSRIGLQFFENLVLNVLA